MLLGPRALALGSKAMTLDRARSLIRDVPDFPSEGILFKDITPILGDPQAFSSVLDGLQDSIKGQGFTRVVAIESRGFLFGAALADRLHLGLAPVRKLGKLPYKTDRVEYALEYGTGTLEAHVDAIAPGDKCVIVDDLLATGGTALAAGRLVEKQGGTIGAYLFAVELAFLKGRERLEQGGRKVSALITF
jgi:adenine phosphoribosyltransferase